MEEKLEQIEDLLADSLETLADKKKFAKTMNTIIKDYSKKLEIDPKIIKSVKNYHHYKGVNWVDRNPLEKNKDIKEKDKIAPIFIKLKEVVDNLRDIGDTEFLNEYIDALDSCGIHISIDWDSSKEMDNELKEILEVTSKLQTNVDTLSTELKETKSKEAEDLNFTPKSSFCNVLGILDKINDGKDVDDKIQNEFTSIVMLNNAYTYLSKVNEHKKEEESD